MNITIHSTIYAVYKKCRNESPLERSFVKAYFSLDQAKKAVRKTIFQLTDSLMTTRNVITDHSTTPEGGEQYRVITAPKNSTNPYHRLEYVLYIHPYTLSEDEETESETEGNTTETEGEEENVSTFGCGTTERCCYKEDHLPSYDCPHPIQDDKDETVVEEDQPEVDHHLDGVQIDRSYKKDEPSVVFMGSAYMKHMDEIQRFDRNELSNVNHNRSSDVDRPSDDRYLPAGQVDPPKAISEADKRLRDTKEAVYLAGLYEESDDEADEDRPPLVDHELISEEEEDVEVEPTTSLGHYLNGFGISSFGIGRK